MDSTISVPFISFSVGGQLPGNDLAKRFGLSNSVGGGIHFKRASNLIYGIQGNFIFGSTLNEPDPLRHLYTSSGEIINGDGIFATIHQYQRGYTVMGDIGKIIPVIGPNRNSGLYINGSIGFFQHKIRIEVENNDVAQLNDDYKKGYDRLTNGLAFGQFIGYLNMSNSKKINYYIGFEFLQAFTRNRREVDFDTMVKDETRRLDTFYGIKIGWILPYFSKSSRKTYYY